MDSKLTIHVVGARPNFVKLAVVFPTLSRYFNQLIIHTGQHYDYELSRIFFKHFDIPEPNYYLGVGSGSHGYQVGEMIKRVEKILLKERPDIVVVYGDTNSTLAGALAAVKAGFKVAHVEAGLRSYDLRMPEEVNRRVVDHISHVLFAPTSSAVNNLREESVMGEVYLVGDVHVDVLRRWLPIAEARSDILDRLGLEPKDYVLVTVHRAENTDNLERLRRIVDILIDVSKRSFVVFPIHPRTRKALERIGLLRVLESVKDLMLVKPLGYLDFIKLLKYSRIVVTDSGGVQREAYLLHVPCLVLRDRTEWCELAGKGYVIVVDLDKDKILRCIEEEPKLMFEDGLLGDGRAGERIARILYEYISKVKE